MNKMALITIILLLISNFYFIGSTDGNEAIDKTRNSDDADWPMFKYDRRHTGYNPEATFDNPGHLRWKTNLNGSVNMAQAFVNDTIILIGTIEGTNDPHEGLHCLYLNGTIKWIYNTNNWVDSVPLVLSDGDIVFTCKDSILYCINHDGKLKWKYQTQGFIISSPILSIDQEILFGSQDGNLYSIYPNGTLNWKFYTSDYIHTSPTIDDMGIIYFGSGDSFYYALYPNGSLKWKYPTSSHIAFSSPLIDDYGNIYFGSGDNNLYSLYPNGLLRWKYITSGDIDSSPSLADNNIYFGSDDGYFYSLKENGELDWKFLTGEDPYGLHPSIRSSPSIDGNGIIYFGARDTYMYALYPNGTLKWKFKTGHVIHSSPSIDNNGNIYFGSLDGFFYSLGAIQPKTISNMNITTGSRFCEIQWQEPDDNGGAPIIHYRIYRNSTKNEPVLVSMVASDILHYNDTNLINGVQYSYWISATNREGESDLAGPIIGIPRGPSLPPRNISIYSGPDFINITWSEPERNGGYPIDSYRIYRSDGGDFSLLDTTTHTFHVDLQVDPGFNYSYYIAAVTAYGEGEPSQQFWGYSLGLPPAPSSIAWGLYNREISMNWSVTLTGLDGYEIQFVRIYRNGSFHEELQVKDLHYNDTGLVNGVNYSYQLSLVNVVGEGPRSDEIVLSPSWVPTPPRNLTARANSSSVVLTWESPEDERGMPVYSYGVHRKTAKENWIDLIQLSDLSWTDRDVEPGKEYQYYVDCTNDRGTSLRSNVVIITIPFGDPPDPPTIRSIVIDENYGIKLEWNSNDDGEMEYRVYSKIGNGTSFVEKGTTGQSSYVDTPTIFNESYHYYVVAVNEYGESPPSNIVSIYVPYETADDDDIDDDDVSNQTDGDDKLFLLALIAIIVVIILIMVGIFLWVRMKKDRPEEETIKEKDGEDDLDRMIEAIPSEQLDDPVQTPVLVSDPSVPPMYDEVLSEGSYPFLDENTEPVEPGMMNTVSEQDRGSDYLE